MWLEWFRLLTIPSWILNIGTAAVGALIAYAVWSWLHSPSLYPGKVIHQEIVEVDKEENQRSIRLPIENIGTKAAENCEAVIQFRVEIDGDVVRSFNPVPWLPARAELVVDDAEHSVRTTIPAARSGMLELIRVSRTGSMQIYPQTGGDKFIRTNPDVEYHKSVDKPADYAVLSPRGTRDSDVIKTSGNLSPSDVTTADWEKAVLELTVETESARPLEVSFNAEVTDEDQLALERQSLPPKRRIIEKLYRVINNLRRFGG